jgi:parvulin-like peptidyl-prolyl isomerase
MLRGLALVLAFVATAASGSDTDAIIGQAADAGSPRGMTPVAAAPHPREAVSRPAGWPGGSGDDVDVGKHVLSSIRKKPGSPLIPVEAFGVKQATGESAAGGIEQAGFDSPSPLPSAVPPSAQSLETALVVARVGPEVVLESDLLTPSLTEWLEKNTAGMTPEQLREVKKQIFRQMLSQYVESLIVYVDACRTIPEDKLPEIRTKVNEAFDEQQLPRLMKDAGVTSVGEYEQMLRSRGQSLDRIRKTFFERALAQQWAEQKASFDGEIPHAELIAYYHANLADYEYPAKAKFEQLMVRIGPSRPREEAWKRIAEMGNAVIGGRPLDDVAREMSDGPTSKQGGGYDWTGKGSLSSTVLDRAIFTLPVGQLSTILEEESALHIIRVTERTEAGRVPFVEAQVEIRRRLVGQRKKHEMETYLTKLRERTPVWTIYDAEPAGPVMAGRPQASPR